MKKLILSILAFSLATTALPQQVKEIEILPNEKWWGGATDLGNKMPFCDNTIEADLQTQNFNNQTTPLLISNKGRYIWCDGPFQFQLRDGKIRIESARGTIEYATAGNTLKEAYLTASGKYLPPAGILPPELFFSKPQYNTWIELIYNQNQEDILKYARSIIDNGFPTGILMIDDNWQKDYGNFNFRPDKFPNPKAMVDELHAMGFKVMLWVSPFVSPDSEEFRYLKTKGYLVKRKGSDQPAILDWWNGSSACYDLSNPEAYNHLRSTLKKMQQDYHIDGFKFDAGDPERYPEKEVDVFDRQSYDTEQTYLWAKLGLEFPYNEFRACWKLGGQPLVQRLGDKKYSWDGAYFKLQNFNININDVKSISIEAKDDPENEGKICLILYVNEQEVARMKNKTDIYAVNPNFRGQQFYFGFESETDQICTMTFKSINFESYE